MENFKKYPRTYHLPWSPGKTSDDKTIKSIDCFKNKEVVVSLKMDGENTTLYHNGIHARSLDYSFHASRTWIQNRHVEIQHLIPVNLRICGENLFAVHSIKYDDLSSYFLAFSVWEGEKCLSWDESVKIFNSLNLEHTPILYKGLFDKNKIEEAFKPFASSHEGYVIRNSNEFMYEDFSNNVAKFVRENHVQTSEHWKNQMIVKNILKK